MPPRLPTLTSVHVNLSIYYSTCQLDRTRSAHGANHWILYKCLSRRNRDTISASSTSMTRCGPFKSVLCNAGFVMLWQNWIRGGTEQSEMCRGQDEVCCLEEQWVGGRFIKHYDWLGSSWSLFPQYFGSFVPKARILARTGRMTVARVEEDMTAIKSMSPRKLLTNRLDSELAIFQSYCALRRNLSLALERKSTRETISKWHSKRHAGAWIHMRTVP
jgi:hypothetical protein